eukprot:m.226804 g.226804  ORF g.226804 m.226804 type:complete len:55 (+) comp17044_c0_seq1:92-256(+)
MFDISLFSDVVSQISLSSSVLSSFERNSLFYLDCFFIVLCECECLVKCQVGFLR